MAFDPDAYLRGIGSQGFDPDKYLTGIGVKPLAEEKGFFERLSEAAESQQVDTEAKTRNPFMGALARVSGLAGAALESPDTLAQLMSNLTGLPKDQVFELPIDTVGKKLADKALNYEKDIGYAPTTVLKDITDNPLNIVPFVAERIITSSPDMAAAYLAAPAYFVTRTNEILKQRVENDEKTLAEATIGDVSAAAGAAAFETTFERFATGRLLPGAGAVGKTAPGRIAKEAGIQSGTEFAEELGTYTAETAGTKKGFDPAEATLAGIEGALVGGGIGTATQGAKEIIGPSPTAVPPAPAAPPTATAPTTPPTVPPAPTPSGAPPSGISPVIPMSPGPGLLGGYVDAGNNTEVRIVPAPNGKFQVVYVDTNTGQTSDAGTFDDFDGANSTAAMLVGVNPATFAPSAPTPSAPPTPPPPTGITPPPPPPPVQPLEPIVGFETSLGSTYSLDELGRSSRTKRSPGKGQGKTYAPHTVFYVTPENSRDILADKVGGKASIRLGYELDGKFKAIKDITELPQGATPLVGVVDTETNTLRGIYKGSTQPAVGLAPVEKLYQDDGTSNTHVGNVITKLVLATQPPTSSTETVILQQPEAIEPAVSQPTITTPAVIAPPEALPEVRDQRTVQNELNRVRQSLRQMETAVKRKQMPESEVIRLRNMVTQLEQELEQAKPTRRVPLFRSKEGNTWTGAGATPTWLKKKLDQGMDLEDFRIRPELDNKSENEIGEMEKPYGFGRPAPATRAPQEIENLISQSERAKRESPNLFNVLRGKVSRDDITDITPENTLNFLKAPKGTGRPIADLVEDGTLDEFLEIPHNAPNFDFQEATEFIKDILRQDFREDPTILLSYQTRMELRDADVKLSELEAELEPEDVNRELQAVYAEERAAAEETQADVIESEERGVAVPTGPPTAIREPISQGEIARPNFYIDLMPNAGFKRLALDDPKTYKNKAGETFLTFERDGVRVAVKSSTQLYAGDRGVGMYMGEAEDMLLQAMIVDEDARRQGRATKALQDILNMADQAGLTVYIEPVQMTKNVGMSTPQLKDFYKRFGFEPQKTEPATDRVMVRQPQKPQAVPEEKRQADLERDLFRLTPPSIPERTTPIGAQRDLFGAAGYTPANVAKRKKENAQQLSLFSQSPLPPNEDNKAGADARREAVSTVDALQSTDTPLALALSTDYAKRQRVSLVGQTLTGHDDLAVLSQVYRHPRFETFRMFFVNDKGEVISQLGVSSRLPASAVAIVGDDSLEYMKKVQDAAVQSGATGVWMLHNHPSGNVKVSSADKNLTKAFTESFDKLAYKGHIVIDTNKYSVITPEGDVKTLSKDMGQKDLVKIEPYAFEDIFNPIEMAKRIDQDPNSMVVVAVNNAAKITGITTISNDFFEGKTRDQARRALYKLAIANVGGRLAVASRDAKALDKVAPMVEDGILIQPDGSYKAFGSMYTFRTKFLFPDERPGVVTPDTSKLFDFLRIPKVPRTEGPGVYRWSDARKLLEEPVTIKVQEPQTDLFGEDAKTLSQINEELPKAKKKLPPGRSPELAALAAQLQAGQVTKEEYDAAVNKYRPIPVYTEPLQPATDEQVVNALSSDKKPKANVFIPTGTKVGLRLDIPAWNNHKTFVVSIHEGRPKPTSPKPGLAIGYRSVALAKNVTFALSNQAKALEIAAGQAKDALQTMEGEYVNVSPEEAYRMAQQAIKDPRYVQLGFDPTRHAYFFDRATTLPVVKADAVLQIGNMILARGVEYGSKQNFLYNIDSQSSLFGNDEAKALKQAEGTLPDFKVVTKGRSPELTEAADKLRKGEITKEEYDAAVKKYSPVTLYAEPPTPPSDQKIEDALDKNKRPYANLDIDSGTKVGLRLDIPAWENKQTWVVAIHAPKPTLTSPKASEILSYRSVAKIKNVKFGVGNQAKTLRIAAGEFKDKLQTMEGEYVSISPEDAYKQAQELIKDPAYIQIGFNPTRHAYFYDRNTMTPVVSADEVLQIGNFILAKGVQFGSKSDFLFDVNQYPQITEDQVETDIDQTREEKISEYARLRAKRSQLVKQYIAQGPSIDLQRNLALTDQLAKDLKEDIDASAAPSLSAENFLRRALDAYEKGDLSPDVLATIRDAYVKTPWVLNGIRLSIRTPKRPGAATGNFDPFMKLVTLWNGTRGIENPSTVRHEVMHSLEQMMTADQRKIVIDSWQDALKAAVKKSTDAQSLLFFENVLKFLDTPSDSSFAATVQSMPSYDFYQYLSPSEYWAVNAEKLFAAKLGTQWERFKSAVRKLIESLKKVFGFDNRLGVHQVFDRLMADKPERMNNATLTDFVTETGVRAMVPQNVSKNIFGQPMPKATWGSPDESKIDDILYVLQDKNIDTKRVVQAITQQRKGLIDKWNPYLQEELYHGRTAKQTDDFLNKELEPLMKALRDRGLTMEQVEEYLHNRHAEERNIQNAKRDPNMPDGGSGILTADARAYLAGLTPKQKKDFEDVAKMVDKIVQGTQDLIVSSGQEKQGVIDNWNNAYKHYVPLNREEADYDVKNVGVGVGSGIAIKGPFSRSSVGSNRKVVDILANVAMQRERAIIRAEKIRVGKAVYSLAVTNPNPGFWLPYDPYVKKDPLQLMSDLVSMGINPIDAENIANTPTRREIDKATNTVKEIPNERLITGALSLPVRINGEEKFIIFNSNDPRAVRMVESLKNLDVDQLSKALGVTQAFTQYFAKINTQYNPIFGVINFTRDVQGALLQLSTTPIAGKQKQVLAGVGPALRGIYGEERAKRKGQPPTNRPWAQLWEEFQQEGGQTGFRDMFSRSQERAEALQRILDPSSWTKSTFGQFITAGGTLKAPIEVVRKSATPIFDWLSDYNQTMENAVRLSAYKVALDQGMTKQQAASIAKNLTVNFNRKGQIGRQMGALYAFFNASVQGTARMYETLTGPAGKMIIGGGLLLGSAQAMLLAMAGFDEDEPPEFVKERNIILPIGGSKYITIPMPLGYNVIPNTSRIVTEWFLSGFKDTPKRIGSIFSATLDMFNPIGNAGWSAQTITPTVLDPVVALTENRDWTGKPIAKEDISSLDPTPGYTRARETASIVGKGLSEFLNYASGGTKYTPGELSPTPDQIDYLIGQFTGGVGREIMKAEQTVRSQITGEDLPIYKVPLVGRFVGDSQGLAAERNRFYNNIIQLNKHEREIKGRRANKENVQEYLMDNPDARLFNYANQVERNIQTLRKRRDILLEKGAPKEQVKVLENQIAAQMKRFNDRVAETQK